MSARLRPAPAVRFRCAPSSPHQRGVSTEYVRPLSAMYSRAIRSSADPLPALPAGLEKASCQLQHARHVFQVVVDVQGEAQHSAADRKLHTIFREMRVEPVVKLVARRILIGAHLADGDDLCEMRAGLASGNGQSEVEKAACKRMREPDDVALDIAGAPCQQLLHGCVDCGSCEKVVVSDVETPRARCKREVIPA